jgi:hypothetical protein
MRFNASSRPWAESSKSYQVDYTNRARDYFKNERKKYRNEWPACGSQRILSYEMQSWHFFLEMKLQTQNYAHLA